MRQQSRRSVHGRRVRSVIAHDSADYGITQLINTLGLRTASSYSVSWRAKLCYLVGMNIQAGGFSFAATEPRNHEHTSEENDQDGGHDKSAADEAAGTCSNGVFFFHWTAPFSDLLTNTERDNPERSAWFRAASCPSGTR